MPGSQPLSSLAQTTFPRLPRTSPIWPTPYHTQPPLIIRANRCNLLSTAYIREPETLPLCVALLVTFCSYCQVFIGLLPILVFWPCLYFELRLWICLWYYLTCLPNIDSLPAVLCSFAWVCLYETHHSLHLHLSLPGVCLTMKSLGKLGKMLDC